MLDLKKARKDAGKTQRELAEECHISFKTVCAIERGRMRPSVEVAKRLADALGLDWTRFYE